MLRCDYSRAFSLYVCPCSCTVFFLMCIYVYVYIHIQYLSFYDLISFIYMLGIASCTLIKSVDVPLLYTHHPRALMHWMGILIVCPSSCSLFFSFTTRAVPQLHFFSPSKKNVSPPVYKPCCKRSWGVTKPDVSQYCQDETNSNRKVLAAAAAAADSTAASTQVPGDKANNPNKNKPAKRKDRLLR